MGDVTFADVIRRGTAAGTRAWRDYAHYGWRSPPLWLVEDRADKAIKQETTDAQTIRAWRFGFVQGYVGAWLGSRMQP